MVPPARERAHSRLWAKSVHSIAMRCHVVMTGGITTTPSWQPTSIGGSTLACKFWASAIDRPLFLRAASSERPHRSCMRAPIFSTQATTTRRLGLVSLACVRLITVHVSESRSADDCRACCMRGPAKVSRLSRTVVWLLSCFAHAAVSRERECEFPSAALR